MRKITLENKVFVLWDIRAHSFELDTFICNFYNQTDTFVLLWNYLEWDCSNSKTVTSVYKTLETLYTLSNTNNTILLAWEQEKSLIDFCEGLQKYKDIYWVNSFPEISLEWFDSLKEFFPENAQFSQTFIECIFPAISEFPFQSLLGLIKKMSDNLLIEDNRTGKKYILSHKKDTLQNTNNKENTYFINTEKKDGIFFIKDNYISVSENTGNIEKLIVAEIDKSTINKIEILSEDIVLYKNGEETAPVIVENSEKFWF